MVCKSNQIKGQDRPNSHHFLNVNTLFKCCVFCCSSFLLSPAALGGSRREEDQISRGSAGGNPDEEAGDQAASLRGAGDHHGPRKRGRE